MKLLLSQCTFCVCTSLQSWSKPHAFIWSLSACCYFFVLFLSFHKPSNSDMDSRTFNMRFIIFFHTYYSVPNDRVCDASLLGCLSKTFFVRAGDMFAHCHPYGSRLTFSTHRSTQTGCSPSEKHWAAMASGKHRQLWHHWNKQKTGKRSGMGYSELQKQLKAPPHKKSKTTTTQNPNNNNQAASAINKQKHLISNPTLRQ